MILILDNPHPKTLLVEEMFTWENNCCVSYILHTNCACSIVLVFEFCLGHLSEILHLIDQFLHRVVGSNINQYLLLVSVELHCQLNGSDDHEEVHSDLVCDQD